MLVHRNPATSQPKGSAAQINRANPLGNLVRLAMRCGELLTDDAGGKPGANNGSTLVGTPYGVGRDFVPGSSQYITLPTTDIVKAYPLTVSVRLRVDDVGAAGFVPYSLSGSSYAAILFAGGSAPNRWLLNSGSAPGSEVCDAVTGWQHLICVHRNGSYSLYKDRVLLTQTSSTGNAVTPSAGNHGIGARVGGATLRYFDGVIQDFVVFEGELTKSQIEDLFRNPYQIYKGRRSILASLSQPQIVYPTGDVAGGTWLPSTGTDLFACVDESAASDADYIYTTVPGAYQEFYFPNCGAVDPSTGGHVRYRIPAGTGTITAILKQGSTTLQTLGTHTLTGSAQDIDITISASVANSDNLRVGFTASA
jgi:hypothetical protein